VRLARNLLIVWIAISILAVGNNAIAAPGRKDADAIGRWYQSMLTKDWLIHVRLEIPAGWMVGAEDILGVSADFPDLPYVGNDFAVFSKMPEGARIAVFYYPVMGRNYYNGVAANFVRQYEKQLDLRYKNFTDRNIGATVLSGASIVTTNIGSKEYYVLRRELRGFPANRLVNYSGVW
jgi:hypothetical protein